MTKQQWQEQCQCAWEWIKLHQDRFTGEQARRMDTIAMAIEAGEATEKQIAEVGNEITAYYQAMVL